MNLDFIPKDQLPQRVCTTTVRGPHGDLHYSTCDCGWHGGYWSDPKWAKKDADHHKYGTPFTWT